MTKGHAAKKVRKYKSAVVGSGTWYYPGHQLGERGLQIDSPGLIIFHGSNEPTATLQLFGIEALYSAMKTQERLLARHLFGKLKGIMDPA